MRAGKLRHRVSIQARAAQADGYNQRSGEWTDVSGLASVAAEVTDLSGLELVRAQKIVAEATAQIVMRGWPGWRQAITPACRALAGPGDAQRIFDIRAAINPDGRNRELRLLCVEIV